MKFIDMPAKTSFPLLSFSSVLAGGVEGSGGGEIVNGGFRHSYYPGS